MYLDSPTIALRIERYLARLMKKRKLPESAPGSGDCVLALSGLLTARLGSTHFSRVGDAGPLELIWSHQLRLAIQCAPVTAWLAPYLPATDPACRTLAGTSFPIMKKSDRVLVAMPAKELEQKVRAEVHPLVDAALAAAEGVLDELRQVETLEQLCDRLHDAGRAWEIDFHPAVALAALTRGPAAAIEAGMRDIEARKDRGAPERVTAPWEEFLRGLRGQLH